MKRGKISQILIGIIFFIPLSFAAGSPEGLWTTIDDKTGKPRAQVQVNLVGGQLSGKIIKIYPEAGDTGICSKCPGAFKNQAIEGIIFLWGLKKNGENTWEGGHILDPKSGKVYRAKLKLSGNRLQVRGYLGVSLLGRTQTWQRKE